MEWLLDGWERLSQEVEAYPLTIDDYTNDLTGRDALELVLDWAAEPLRNRLRARVTAAYERFREATDEDRTSVVGRYFRVDASSGWWWHRLPRSGRLAGYLARST